MLILPSVHHDLFKFVCLIYISRSNSDLCFDGNKVQKFQSFEYSIARREILNSAILFKWTHNDGNIYNYSFHEKEIFYSGKILRNFVIWKCASTYIYKLLRQAGTFVKNPYSSLSNDDELPFLTICESNTTQSYNFAFLRNPMTRFISGYTQLDYAMTKYKRHSEHVDFIVLNLKFHYGSVERFQELIEYILNSNMSAEIFSFKKAVDVAHVAPMIGIILTR